MRQKVPKTSKHGDPCFRIGWGVQFRRLQICNGRSPKIYARIPPGLLPRRGYGVLMMGGMGSALR
eukprot:2219068-Rhodomonas_salina.2